MRATLPAVLLLALGASSSAEAPKSSCAKLVDVPEPRVEFAAPSPAGPTSLQRSHALLRLFSEGDGEWRGSRDEPAPSPAAGVVLHPLPWNVAPGREARARLVTWQRSDRGNEESMPAIVLAPGESWCTSPLELRDNARLRLEAVSVGRARAGALRVEIEDGGTLFEAELPFVSSLEASRQIDRELPRGRHSLCFRASRAPLAISEPRVLAPEAEGSDPRPRWLVLTILDAFRGDLLRRPDASSLLPSLSRLAETGRHYRNAVSPGCHTRAAVWPILMGRDLMRIDPLQRRQTMPIQAPLESLYARANLFVSHLAESAGYHAVFLGNNTYLRMIPAFSRYSSWGNTDTGTIDTIQKLPDLFSRYADERVLLVYYVSTPHGHSMTPRRLYDALGCGGREELDECRCSYEARARHADEAVAALQEGLSRYRLEESTLQIVTADHGELFGDGMKVEGEFPTFYTGERQGVFQAFDRGHGNACHPLETDVPILVHGDGIAPARIEGRVSGLDIAPTLMTALGQAPKGKLDGSSLLLESRASGSRRLVTHGFCADSSLEGNEQLVWWIEGCRLREIEGQPLTHRAELWKEGRRVATDATAPERLHRAMAEHESWLRERLPSDAFVFGSMGMEEATLRVTPEGGRIVDYGPSSTIDGLDGVDVLRAAPDGSELVVRFRSYRGLYHVSTLPQQARIRIEVVDRPDVVTFVGPMQLPLETAGRYLDPAEDAGFLFSPRPPRARESPLPALRFWWHPYRAVTEGTTHRERSDFDRVLREWGYIR